MSDIKQLRENIDLAVQAWLAAQGIDDDTMGDLDYNDFDDEVNDLLLQAKGLE